jgi:hypothetical protein
VNLIEHLFRYRRTDTDADYTAGTIGEVLLDRGVIPGRVCAFVKISAV